VCVCVVGVNDLLAELRINTINIHLQQNKIFLVLFNNKYVLRFSVIEYIRVCVK